MPAFKPLLLFDFKLTSLLHSLIIFLAYQTCPVHFLFDTKLNNFRIFSGYLCLVAVQSECLLFGEISRKKKQGFTLSSTIKNDEGGILAIF